MLLQGKVWVINGRDGKLIDDIDTDMIYHNAHLAVTKVSEMARYSFGNLEGWRDFPKKAGRGDIIVAGRNFGCGSSRQHAVDCFRALGISAIIVESVGAIYKRNAVNSGFALLVAEGISASGIETADEITVNLVTGEITVPKKRILFYAKPFSNVQAEIYNAGSLFAVRH